MIIKPPSPFQLPQHQPAVFLAGSIEQGTAPNWQAEMEQYLDPISTVLNPRRDDWDASWVQSIDNPQFREQVVWELDAMEMADIIAMYFAPGTQSPITLLEFGLYARSNKLFVCCPDGFWRKGNVEVVCDRHETPFFHDKEGWMGAVRGNVLGMAKWMGSGRSDG